jgi:hypothetical protein
VAKEEKFELTKKTLQEAAQEVEDSLNSNRSGIYIPDTSEFKGQKETLMVREFNPDTDERVPAVSEGRNHPRPVVLRANNKERVCFAKRMNTERIDDEVWAYDTLAKAGIRTLKVQAVVPMDTDEAIILTQQENMIPISRYTFRSFEDFVQVAESMTAIQRQMHIAGVIQADPDPKNFGISTEDGGIIPYDFDNTMTFGKFGWEVTPDIHKKNTQQMVDLLVKRIINRSNEPAHSWLREPGAREELEKYAKTLVEQSTSIYMNESSF